MPDDTNNDTTEASSDDCTGGGDLSATRLPESDVYHLSRGDGPLCRKGRTVRNGQDIPIEEAEKFFSRCEICSKMYHEDTGLTTKEMRQNIRQVVGLPPRPGAFVRRELAALLDELVGRDIAAVDSDRDGGDRP